MGRRSNLIQIDLSYTNYCMQDWPHRGFSDMDSNASIMVGGAMEDP